MRRDTIAFALYVAAVVAVTLIHHTALLVLLLAAALIAAGKDRARAAARALRAIVVFNAVVSVSYIAVSAMRGDFSPGYLLLVNVRVFLLAFLTALAARRINILRAFSFSRTLSYVIVLALGQLAAFRRLLGDFRLALESRTARRAKLRDMYRQAASSASFFYLKAVDGASEITEGMKSRGFFDA